MLPDREYRSLTPSELQIMRTQGCRAVDDDWDGIRVAEGFDAQRMRNVVFAGQVRIGSHTPSHARDRGPSGMENAHVVDCTIGNDVRIAHVARRIANYHIADGSCLEDVGLIEARHDARFGNGIEVEALNEGGGREVVLFNDLCAQTASLMCLCRHRPDFIEKLTTLVRSAASRAHGGAGMIGPNATVRSVRELVDVCVHRGAVIDGASSLANGTILSSDEAPTTVGAGVQADDFIIAEGASVTDGAMLTKCYVGQGSRIARQFSAESSLFFANCEAFHGEAVSVFAGPYTVTHHKSTLLIAGLHSFYNAGSGTNFSNHRYKLGPVHEGKLERGTKTGSFSYLMWPCRVGAFSVVLGKHTRVFDTRQFPFSAVEADPAGRCTVVPGIMLATVGTVRDGAKWPTRDRRRGESKRDRITFDVLSPFTVGWMIRGRDTLEHAAASTERSRTAVAIDGAEIKRVLLKRGAKYYRRAITMYLTEQIIDRVESEMAEGAASPRQAMTPSPRAVFDESWVDVGGQLMPRRRLEELCEAVEQGRIDDVAGCQTVLDEIHASYCDDRWLWVKSTYESEFDVDLSACDADDFRRIADMLLETKRDFLRLVLIDAEKEFDSQARIGFGVDGNASTATADFEAVRGRSDDNEFVCEVQRQIAALQERVNHFKNLVQNR